MQANILKESLLFGNGNLSLIKEPLPKTAVKGPAYNFTRDQILEYLRAVKDKPNFHGVKYATRDMLKIIYKNIVELSAPNGIRYENPSPKQHIRRKFVHRILQVEPFIPASELAYWSPHDLLGLFLSSIPAPPAAQWDNFYVPLLYVYGRWGACLGSSWNVDGTGTGDEPYMTQATWSNDPNNLRYHLGCSMAGYSKELNPRIPKNWRTVVGESRFGLLEYVNLGPSYNFDNSPNIASRGYTGTRFGNCAETYPFATFFCQGGTNFNDIGGIALSKDAYKLDTYSDKVLDKVFNPCENCAYLIEVSRGYLPNFVWVEKIKALQQKQVP